MSEYHKGKLRELFHKIVDKYDSAQWSCIYETSTNIRGDEVELEIECQQLKTDFEELLASS